MRPPWKHLLTGTALAAVLALGDGFSAGSDPPPKPVVGTAAEPAPLAPKGDADLQRQRETYRAVMDQLRQLLERQDRLREMERTYAREVAASDQSLAKLREQIEDIKRGIADAETKKARLEEALKAAEAKQAEGETPHIKVFHLSHIDPNDMASVLATLLPGRARFGAAGRRETAGGARGGFGAIGAAGGGVAAPGGRGGFAPFPGGFAGGGGFGGFGAMPARLRVAVDPRTHSLIARGSDADLQTAADLIAALDRDDGKTTAHLKEGRVFRLRYARPEEVQGILQTLDIGARVAALPGAKLLVAYGPESALKEVGEVVEAVDVATPPAPKPGKPGKPGGKH